MMTHFRSDACAQTDAHLGAVREGLPQGPTGAQGREFVVTIEPRPGEHLVEVFRRLDRALKESAATILKLVIYGPVKAAAPANEAIQRILGKINWPVTWIEGLACNHAPIAGIQAFAFSGGNVGRLALGGRVVGSVFEADDTRFCLLGGLSPEGVDGTKVTQTEQTLERMQAALAQGGFALGDVVRTWFFLDDLLSWYDAFNEIRAKTYSTTKFSSGCLPASTGIAGRNPAGAALVTGACATQPVDPVSRAVEVLSPLQCPASDYGSAFSRAVEINSAGWRRLFISGTASIDAEGRTLHQGDIRAQIELSLRVVEAILESRRMSFADVTRATAYFKSAADAPAFAEWRDRCELRHLPVISAVCDVCRPELLFEIEVDAAALPAGRSH